MELIGWEYVGRNIDKSLHEQFRTIVDCLSDTSFVHGRVWSDRSLQQDLAHELGNSDGQIRTVKRMFEDLGLINKGSLNRTDSPERAKFMSEVGEKVYNASCLEKELDKISDKHKKEAAHSHIKGLYEEGYCMAMARYYFEFPQNKRLHPLRATLKALQEYGPLDKWEWYLLNTVIREDDNVIQENLLNKYIKDYRNGNLSFSMSDVISKPKGHQYHNFTNFQGCLIYKTEENGKFQTMGSVLILSQ